MIKYIVHSIFANILLYISVLTIAYADDMTVLKAIDKNSDSQLVFLEKLVNQNSGTLNVSGVRSVGSMFKKAFRGIGYKTRWISMPKEMARAGHLVATRNYGPGPHVLLIGHLDTVFEKNSPFQEFKKQGDIAKGPGVLDMKGGNTVILYSLKALQEANVVNAGRVTVFLTGDEESVGQPIETSRKDLIAVGKAADVALNFESGSPKWGVIGRRGSSSWSIEVTGKRAHSSGVFSDNTGAGAIFEVSRILNRFYNEVRGPFGLTFNAGVLAGGTLVDRGDTANEYSIYGKRNVVAQKSVVRGGLRFMDDRQHKQARDLMRKIVKESLPQTSAEIIFWDRYPAMEATASNRDLLKKLNHVHARLGLKPAKAFPPERRGAADISFVAPYITSMDGLGVEGGGSHSIDEYMHIPSLKQTTRRAALLIHDLLSE